MDARRTGAFIAELRNDKGWKQIDLAAILQVSDKAISHWETGKCFPDTSLLIHLSEACHKKIHKETMRKIKNATLFCSVFSFPFPFINSPANISYSAVE